MKVKYRSQFKNQNCTLGLTDEEKNAKSPLKKERIQELKFMTPMLPYTETDDNLNLMLYDSNG